MKKFILPPHLKHLDKTLIELQDENAIQPFFDAIALSNPKNILETGVMMGMSSLALLILSDANLTSFDPIMNATDDNNLNWNNIPYPDKSEQEQFLDKIKLTFKDRWTFYKEKSENAYPLIQNIKYDLFHIDGDHWYSGLDADYDIALKMNIEWLLVDDFSDIVAQRFMEKLRGHYMPIRSYNRSGIPAVIFKKIGRVNFPKFA
jgi:hypothetical protein